MRALQARTPFRSRQENFGPPQQAPGPQAGAVGPSWHKPPAPTCWAFPAPRHTARGGAVPHLRMMLVPSLVLPDDGRHQPRACHGRPSSGRGEHGVMSSLHYQKRSSRKCCGRDQQGCWPACPPCHARETNAATGCRCRAEMRKRQPFVSDVVVPEAYGRDLLRSFESPPMSRSCPH
jgi:hypothetical protein